MIRVIFVPVGERAEVREIESTGEAFTALVGGPFEGWGLLPNVMIICRDDNRGLFPNRSLPRVGWIFGPFLVVGGADEEGNTMSLPPGLARILCDELNRTLPSPSDPKNVN